ncbi:MAG: patatin-like phospholipase family protein [Lewinellaceae bacterium]|nr:patatin-like phospholipase family protein [Lewinellaceae bacterium]
MAKKKTGLVLSGGGVRGVAHIGVLKALSEHQITIDIVAGASAGAIVGAFFSAGYTWKEILAFFKETSFFKVSHYAFGKPGFIDSEKFAKTLHEYFPEDDFQALKKPLFVSATDILKGKSELFSSGPLVSAILASAAFPVVLTPVQRDGKLYADGGILNNFPVEPIRPEVEQLIGVLVNPLPEVEISDIKNSMDVLERAYELSIAKQSVDKLDQCDIVIYPQDLEQIYTFDTRQIDRVFDIGYQAGIQALEKWPGS